jgi:hypothetical protein
LIVDALQFYKTAPIRARFKSLAAISIIAALAVGFGIAACKSRPVEAPAPPVQTVSRGPTDEPTKTLPADLPPQLPVYPGVTVEHVRKPRGAMREIIMSTPGDLNKLVAFFKDGLKGGDFRVTSSLIMPARKTWSCDFQKGGRPGSILLYPSDADKTRMTIDLIYELPPSKMDEALIEPREDFDVIGPGEVAQAPSAKEKEKRN